MKRLFFVVGPESAGNRLTTRILCESGCFGGYDHYQVLDEFVRDNNKNLESIIGESELVVFRRSIPHGDGWPIFKVIFDKFEGFERMVVIPVRNLYELCKSKINNNGKVDLNDAYNSVTKESEYLTSQLIRSGINGFFPFNVSLLFKEPDFMLDKLAAWSGLTIDHDKIKSFLYDADKNHMEESLC